MDLLRDVTASGDMDGICACALEEERRCVMRRRICCMLADRSGYITRTRAGGGGAWDRHG